jgi:hypothetical protein
VDEATSVCPGPAQRNSALSPHLFATVDSSHRLAGRKCWRLPECGVLSYRRRLVREQDAPRSTGPGQVCAGTINAFVESASIGVKDPGDVMLTYGTTMGIAGVLIEPHPSREVCRSTTQTKASAALLSSDDCGSSVERTATLYSLWRARRRILVGSVSGSVGVARGQWTDMSGRGVEEQSSRLALTVVVEL